MNKGFLVVYNTCNLYRDNVDETLIRLWIDDIQSILEQSFENYHLAISECRGPEKSLIESNPLMDEFIQNVVSTDSSYNIIYENLPMNATFHYTVMEIVKKLGKFEYYMYISSGISFRNVSDEKIDVFKKIYDFLKQNQDIARLNLSAINDNCFPPLSQDYIDSLRTEPYYMKPGYRVNDHCSIYSNDLYEAYNGRLRPDIYIGNGSEPPFSYLTSAINKKNVIAPLYICPPLVHNKRQDGANPGIGNQKWFLNYDSHEKIMEFRKRMEKNNIFIDYGPEGGGSSTNDSLTEENKKIIEKTFGSDGVTMNELDRKNLLKILKKELFVTQDIIDYNNLNNKLL
jgi:hypothetical protein